MSGRAGGVRAEESPELRAAAEALRGQGIASAQLVLADGRSVAVPALVAHRAKMRERMAEGLRVIQRLSEEDGAQGG